jgi:hypothetical protein
MDSKSTTADNYMSSLQDGVYDDDDSNNSMMADDENYDTNSVMADDSPVSASAAVAEAIVQEQQGSPINSQASNSQDEFHEMMSSRKNETNDFRLTIISIGLTLISIGILINLIFNLLVVLRKKRRQTCTTLLMFSMCFAYLIYLAFYSLKLSIYFNGDNITKYHIYDTVDNWTYGAFLCKFLSALPIAVKLISRLSILTIVFKRVVAVLVCGNSKACEFSSERDDHLDDVKFKEFFIKNSVKFKSTTKLRGERNNFETSLENSESTG